MRYLPATPSAAQDELNQQLALALYNQGSGRPMPPPPTPGEYAGGIGAWRAEMNAGLGDASQGADVDGEPSGGAFDQAPDLSALGRTHGLGASGGPVQLKSDGAQMLSPNGQLAPTPDNQTLDVAAAPNSPNPQIHQRPKGVHPNPARCMWLARLKNSRSEYNPDLKKWAAQQYQAEGCVDGETSW